jgi:hypothetical protein
MTRASKLGRIHWRAPATIMLAFVAALCFAIGHHVFYKKLDGRSIDPSDRMFDQQINGAIGTGFAFLFRASLAIAIGGVYWQVFWGTATRERDALTVASLDSLTGLLSSIFNFFDHRTLLGHPDLAALALLAWLIPLSALLPPATLSVVNVNQPETRPLRVSAINFTSSALARFSPIYAPNFYYQGADPQLRRLLTATTFRSAVPDFPAVAVNATYKTTFAAPCLQCQLVSEADTLSFRDFMFSGFYPTYSCERTLSYASWAPDDSSTKPWYQADNSCLIDGPETRNPRADYASSNAILIAWKGMVLKTDTVTKDYEWNLLNCSLHNASYTVDVAPVTNDRSIFKAWSVESHEHIPSLDVSAKGTRLVSENPLAGSYGYKAILECMIDVTKGYILDTNNGEIGVASSSDITQTTLVFTRELLEFARTQSLGDYRAMLDERSDATCIVDRPWPQDACEATTFNQSLAYGVEQLFQNMTLSLFSKSQYLAETGPITDVVLDRWLNVYAYDQKNLLISYGVALVLTLLACAMGCVTVYRNGVSYSNLFSTVLRTTRRQHNFDALLVSQDQSGADPLPRHLSAARIQLGPGQPVDNDDSHNSQIELSQRQPELTAPQSERSTRQCSGEEWHVPDPDSQMTEESGTVYTSLPDCDTYERTVGTRSSCSSPCGRLAASRDR